MSNYPKSYVLERIEARRSSLAARQREIESEAIGFAEEMEGALEIWTNNFHSDLHRALEVNIFNAEDAQRAEDLATGAGGPLPGFAPTPYAHDNLTREQRLTLSKREADRRDQEYDRNAKELDAIDHVKAYLEGTPVDEFSLTQLRTLNLLDFVKFNLTRAKEQTR